MGGGGWGTSEQKTALSTPPLGREKVRWPGRFIGRYRTFLHGCRHSFRPEHGARMPGIVEDEGLEAQLETLEVELWPRLLEAEGVEQLSRALMSRFPFNGSFGLEWRKVRDVTTRPAPPEPPADARLTEYGFLACVGVPEVMAFLAACLQQNDITAERVGLISFSVGSEYEMDLSVLPHVLQVVADLPEHRYVFALDYSWCLMWSDEEDLFFGLARNVLETVPRFAKTYG